MAQEARIAYVLPHHRNACPETPIDSVMGATGSGKSTVRPRCSDIGVILQTEVPDCWVSLVYQPRQRVNPPC